MIGLQGRRRRSKEGHRVLHFRANDGHVAPVIPRRFFLLEAAFLLLVDDDEPEIVEWRKDRRARSHDDARLAMAHAPPFARALDVAQCGVQHRDAFESRAKPRAALPADPQCQRNFRHQHDRGLAARQRLLHAAHVHFGLPAAGDAVQQQHAELAQLESRANRTERALLLRVQLVRGQLRNLRRMDLLRDRRALPSSPAGYRATYARPRSRNAGQFQQQRQWQRPALREHRSHPQ